MHVQTHRMDKRMLPKELKFTISFRIIYFAEWDKPDKQYNILWVNSYKFKRNTFQHLYYKFLFIDYIML